MSDQPPLKLTPPIKSYVIRTGRMTPAQKRGWDEWPQFGLTQDQGMINPATLFPKPQELVLEIGYGMGQSLITMAQQELDKNFIGIEVHKPGVGSLIHQAKTLNLANIKTYCDDAIAILTHCIPDASMTRIQLYFADPWHKKRHHKRRIVQTEFVALVCRKLKIGAHFHMATDWPNYAEHMLDVMQENSDFVNLSPCGHFINRPDYRPITKFEHRGQLLKHPIFDLLFEKRPPAK